MISIIAAVNKRQNRDVMRMALFLADVESRADRLLSVT